MHNHCIKAIVSRPLRASIELHRMALWMTRWTDLSVNKFMGHWLLLPESSRGWEWSQKRLERNALLSPLVKCELKRIISGATHQPLLKCSLLGAKLGKMINNIIFPSGFVLRLKLSKAFYRYLQTGIIAIDAHDSLYLVYRLLLKQSGSNSLSQNLLPHSSSLLI